jgi:hypothetical protein
MTGTQNINRDILLLSTKMRHHVIRESMIVTPVERSAEYELALLARDKRYYDNISEQCIERHIDPTSRYRNEYC